MVFTLARRESTVDGLVVSRGVVCATNSVVDVLTELGSVRASGITSLVAENPSSDEVTPLNNLGISWASRGVESARVHEGTERVSSLISSVRVFLTSSVIGLEVEGSLLDEPNGLDVSRCTGNLKSSDGSSRDQSGSELLGCTVGYHLPFNVPNDGVRFGSTPQAELLDGVDESGLTHGILVLGCCIALVVTLLSSTRSISRVSLIRQVRPSESFLIQGYVARCG